MEYSSRHANIRTPGKKRRESCRQDFGWDHEHETVGHGDEAAADEDVGFAIDIIRTNELIGEAEGAAEIGGPGLLGDERIRASFDDVSVDVFGAEDAAEIGRRIIKSVFDCARAAMFFKRESGGESGDATTDDRNAGHECDRACGSSSAAKCAI